MAAHRCCPGCGAELTTEQTRDGVAEGTGCGCAGPFTVDGGGHGDPLHIRPYVDLPDGDSASAHGSASAPDGPAAPGTSAADDATRPVPDLSPFARCGTDETTELPTFAGEMKVPAAGAGAASAAGGRGAERSRRGRRGLRRPGNALLAGVGMAAALGAGLLTTDLLSKDDGGGDTRSLSAGDRAPDLGPEGEASAPEPRAHRSSVAPSASASASPSTPQRSGSPSGARADRDSGVHTERPTPTASSSATRTPDDGQRDRRPGDDRRPDGDRTGGDGGGDGGTDSQESGPVLRVGDSGPEVRELQYRLRQAGFLEEGEDDGTYSAAVQQAVFRYQTAYGVPDDVRGEYGPKTRASLEARTRP
ncbi:peptidoglycan-binding domain-containing protein [Streptomyces sp. ODS28]|uniref:peptidoglycan-binding domain-containing protein n=1 Tax=Streptomyces sp. ODS28 TaxID=3136688 RepID=UPI0031F18B3E